jgi:hypothetical protein
MIPVALLLSRAPFPQTLISMYPLALYFSSISSTPTQLLTNAADNLISNGSISFSFPPSPLLVSLLFPFLRAFYARSKSFILYTIFKIPKYPIRSFVEMNVDNGNIRRQGQPGQGELADMNDIVVNRIELETLAKFLAKGVEALLFPVMAAAVGKGLFYLATRSNSPQWTRSLLGINSLFIFATPSINPVSTITPNVFVGKFNGFMAGLFKSAGQIPLDAGRASTKVDPIWWRNCVGAVIVLLTRDCYQLVTGVLFNREARSKKLVGRYVRSGRIGRR